MNDYKIGVDLGTSNILVYTIDLGIIFNEPSIVIYDFNTNKPIAFGKGAHKILGKDNKNYKVVKPIVRGVLADIDAAKLILEYALRKLEIINYENSTLLICCPSDVTSIERNALIRLGNILGFKKIIIEEEVKAGALGTGVDIFAPYGHLIIDIGGGSTDIGLLSIGGVVASDTIRVAGDYIDKAIINYIRFKYNVEISEKEAEHIKIKIATLRKEAFVDKIYRFTGKQAKTHKLIKIQIKKSEIRSILLKVFDMISYKLLTFFRDISPELSSDILENGIILNGGGALIDGISEYFQSLTGLRVNIPKNPLTSVAEGTKYLLLMCENSYNIKRLK